MPGYCIIAFIPLIFSAIYNVCLVSTALKSLDIKIAVKGAKKELVYKSHQLPTDVNVSQDMQASTYCERKRLLCDSNPCWNDGRCEETANGYVCTCPGGFTGLNCETTTEADSYCKSNGCQLDEACATDKLNSTCICIDPECLEQAEMCGTLPCLNGGICIVQNGQYHCRCRQGFSGKNCEEIIDFCKLLSINCLNEGLCLSLVGGYNVSTALKSLDIKIAVKGAKKELVYKSHQLPTDVNVSQDMQASTYCERKRLLCDSNPCWNDGRCEETANGYVCTCPGGFTGLNCETTTEADSYCKSNGCQLDEACATDKLNSTCICIDPECLEQAEMCGTLPCLNGGICIVQNGQYHCRCRQGFSGKNCEEIIDFCKLLSINCLNEGLCLSLVGGYNCSEHAVCLDQQHNYTCHCMLGYEGTFCELETDECKSAPCANGATCIDLVAGYQCLCAPGFKGRTCSENMNECWSRPCLNGGTCIDLVNDYICICPLGFTGHDCSTPATGCTSNPCDTKGTSMCEEQQGGFKCMCHHGYTGLFCETSISHCVEGLCHHGSKCVDLPLGFVCECLPGLRGRFCEVNIDDCLDKPCGALSICKDGINAYDCFCAPGFVGNNCEIEVNECLSQPCQNGASCADELNSFSCLCPAGTTGINCESLPCEAANPCDNGAECVEEADPVLFPLGFRCRCRQGFTGPRCEINIDECSSNPCLHGFCYDAMDGFYCLCNPGYAGIRCEQDINDCVSNMCENNSTCVDLHLSYDCLCLPGWEGEFCQWETDECSSNPCKNNATCTDLLNAYSCTCPHGWTGLDCGEDVKECSFSPCLNGAHCVESDIPGEFSCTCPPFYTGLLCEQAYDPCDLWHNPCLHNSTCRANCFCKPGFSGQHCEEDINECASNPCQNRGVCQDLVNGFQCNCVPGYFGTLCNLDINECEASPCLHDSVCINKPGGFICVCRTGFSGKWCELNVDECKSNPCRNKGRCIDGLNGYQCVCSRGFMGYHCERNTDECSSNPCVHGSCLDEIDAYSCQCEVGWTGHRCEININDKYACICAEGFTGKNCEIDQNVCLQTSLNFSLCFNGGTCVDGPGANFTCSCMPGFVGDFCEVEMNECCSEPCFHGAICQDLINGYQCHCRPGWTGLHCEDDINECLLQPCNQGMCIQNEPGHGYTCFCRPGFVGENCEYNYDDCLIQSCPDGFSCKDSINNVSCVPVKTDSSSVPPISVVSWRTIQDTEIQPTLAPVENLQNTEQPTDISFGRYSGKSFLEFEGIEVGAAFSVTVRFLTEYMYGTLLYSASAKKGIFSIKLYISNGALWYDFMCNQKEGVKRINTAQQVADGNEHVVLLKQYLSPCAAEVTITGFRTVGSIESNYTSAVSLQRTDRVFIGGLPLRYPPYKEAEPFHNYTGCIEIIEINKLGRFRVDHAIARNNVDNCRSPWHPDPPANSTDSPPRFITVETPPDGRIPPTQPSPVCPQGLCLNGGSCRPISLPSGASSFFCDCSLHFTGRLCEQDSTIFSPRFDGTSFLELPSLTSLFQSDTYFTSHSSEDRRTLYLTMKSKTPHGTLLYSQEQNFGDRFLHVFLQNGRPVAKLGCSDIHVLTAVAPQNIRNNSLVPIIVRYALPSRDNDRLCIIEIAVANGTANRQQKYMDEPVSEVVFGPTFLGGVPSLFELHHNSGNVSGFIGCIRELQMGSKELYVVGEAIRGQNIQNCDTAVCQHQPCRNGGTCISDAENWFCACPSLYSGKLCQFTACERNPCARGATCVPQTRLEAACLCPYGRQGLLCDEAVNITRPRFSGLDEFGYSSYVAYPSIPSMGHFYEFHLKLTFANNVSALRNNLILFSGQKGQGISGDDFFALGVRNGRIVHKYNLGSGLATITSERLNLRINIHTVHFGRYLKNGWLKVDGQKRRMATSPGPLVGLNTFSQLYLGGYEEYTPELLPAGSRFQNSFQGCIFDLLFRTRRDGKFHPPGGPEGRPVSGRNVGQCGVNPCSLVICQNGGTCVDSGSSVYCQCVFGWKGALCSEKVSFCDAEHIPPPNCARGATCVPLPDGYTCQCPLGSAGLFCQQGDFLSISLSAGFVQLRYNLGNETIILQSPKSVDVTGMRWHTVKAGREGSRGFLILDDEAVTRNSSEGTTTLDVSTNIFIGGVSLLNAVPPGVTEKEPVGFTGGIREVIVNGQDLELTETGAIDGVNVGDWDGTACGYKDGLGLIVSKKLS
ncbi:eyes shut-like protein [Labeo rohita]|uniref:Eyes shut-like protein n=1 Tax=Labeo rohita TaxID=84645 RepID=A0A498LS51_LABRO|nr:eyes shut-like protein [Labeo rohita]